MVCLHCNVINKNIRITILTETFMMFRIHESQSCNLDCGGVDCINSYTLKNIISFSLSTMYLLHTSYLLVEQLASQPVSHASTLKLCKHTSKKSQFYGLLISMLGVHKL